MLSDEIKIELCKNPEKIVDPKDANVILAFIGGHITELEETEYEQQLIADTKFANLTEKMTVGKAEVMWRITEEYRALKMTQKELKKFRRFRETIRGRFEVLLHLRPHIRNF